MIETRILFQPERHCSKTMFACKKGVDVSARLTLFEIEWLLVILEGLFKPGEEKFRQNMVNFSLKIGIDDVELFA